MSPVTQKACQNRGLMSGVIVSCLSGSGGNPPGCETQKPGTVCECVCTLLLLNTAYRNKYIYIYILYIILIARFIPSNKMRIHNLFFWTTRLLDHFFSSLIDSAGGASQLEEMMCSQFKVLLECRRFRRVRCRSCKQSWGTGCGSCVGI